MFPLLSHHHHSTKKRSRNSQLIKRRFTRARRMQQMVKMTCKHMLIPINGGGRFPSPSLPPSFPRVRPSRLRVINLLRRRPSESHHPPCPASCSSAASTNRINRRPPGRVRISVNGAPSDAIITTPTATMAFNYGSCEYGRLGSGSSGVD